MQMTNQPTLHNETQGNARIIAHQVSFVENNNRILGKVSLFGGFDYKVDLGPYPFRISSNNFGCGHLFDPINKIVSALSATPIKIIGQPEFTCFKR